MKEDYMCPPSPLQGSSGKQGLTDRQAAMERCNAARQFPHNTCGASRHLQIAAEHLIRDGVYHMLQEDPAYMAEAMLAVVTDLWEARTKLAALAPPSDSRAAD